MILILNDFLTEKVGDYQYTSVLVTWHSRYTTLRDPSDKFPSLSRLCPCKSRNRERVRRTDVTSVLLRYITLNFYLRTQVYHLDFLSFSGPDDYSLQWCGWDLTDEDMKKIYSLFIWKRVRSVKLKPKGQFG